jgi:uncharacterized protein (TIGR02001 family)
MEMMKKTLIATTVLAATSTAAMAEISGNVALSSDYVWRGISQTDNQMAISGGFDYAHDSGLYIGTWASNVNSDFFDNETDPQIELDIYAGYAGEFGAIGYDLGFTEYIYPGSSDINTLELYAGGSYGFTDTVSGAAKYYYSDDFFDTGDSAWRIEAGVDVGLPQDFSLSALVGKNDGEFFDGGFDYVDYSIGVSKPFVGLDFGLTYTDTDLDDSDCQPYDNICDGRVVFSVSKSL